MSFIRSHDRKLVELNARYLTKAALAFDIPIILSTVGVQMGVDQPTIASLGVKSRTCRKSTGPRWTPGPLGVCQAVKKTGRKRLVDVRDRDGGVPRLSRGGRAKGRLRGQHRHRRRGGLTRESHDVAVLRMIEAGAVPSTTQAMITGMVSRLAGPLAPAAREVIVPFLKETAILQHIIPLGDCQSWRTPQRLNPSRPADGRGARLRRGDNDRRQHRPSLMRSSRRGIRGGQRT